MRQITPFLWFDNQAEEAVDFFASVFDDVKVTKIARYPEGAPAPAGSVMTVDFELEGKPFVALNGGPHFKFTEAISFVVSCDTQDEIDEFWEKLTAGGGEESQCGWLKDRFGLSWQIVPRNIEELMTDPDPERSRRVTEALMGMKKIDIGELERAREGEAVA
jgi:predicted 3-demethylubiquinone-9 3-methyltransferase (glyoxalase superfamily)